MEDGIFLKSLGLFASIKEEREPKLLRLVRYPASLHWWMEDLWLWVLPRRWSSRPYHLPEELPTELPQCWVATLPFRPASPRCMDLIVPVWQQIRVARSILEAVVEVGSDEQETLVLLMAEATSEQSRAFESTDGFVRGLLRRRMQMTSYEQDFADNHPVAHLLRYLRLVDQLSERLACDRCSTKQPLRTRTAPVASSSSPSSSPLSSSSSATPSSSSSGMGQRWSVDGSIEEFMMLEGCLPISTDGFRPPPTAQEWQPAEEERITKRCYRYPFLPFERSLAEEALRCLDTHRGCCVVLEHAVPTLGLGALLIMEFLRSHAAGRRAVVWIVGEEEADACRCLLGRVLEQEGPLGDAAISFWSWSTFSRHPDPLPPVDLLVISRFSFNDQVRHLERVRAGRTVAFSGWPASCSSDLYRAMGLLGISKIVARRSDHVALEAQRSAWFRPQLLDDQRIGQVLASCKARLSELSEVVRREGLAPDGWIESLPGSEEFELALAALAEEAPEHPLVPVLKALCVLVGVMDRLLHQGAQAADEFLEECQPLGSGNAVELPLLSRLAKEAQARIAPSFLSQVFQQVASSHGYRSTLVVVDANLARDAVVASADDIPRGASLLLGPASLEELATVAYRGGIAVIQAKCLPNIEGLFGSDLIGLWPFDRVVDFTSRWKGYAFLANQLLREPAERTVACARVRLAAAPQDTHRWIGHFQAGCPGGQVEEIAFLDYEIVFSDPPLTMVPSKPNPISPTNHKSTKPSTIKPLKNARMGSSFTSILNRADRNVGGE
ncbi:MAG: hypothetical protein Q8P67_17175, partial [archaeon]|nr:hypothetical protein [archaeon]